MEINKGPTPEEAAIIKAVDSQSRPYTDPGALTPAAENHRKAREDGRMRRLDAERKAG